MTEVREQNRSSEESYYGCQGLGLLAKRRAGPDTSMEGLRVNRDLVTVYTLERRVLRCGSVGECFGYSVAWYHLKMR